MVKNKNIRIVTEDAVLGVGHEGNRKHFGKGYEAFEYPYTVSFCSEGRYEVVIKGKDAYARKID